MKVEVATGKDGRHFIQINNTASCAIPTKGGTTTCAYFTTRSPCLKRAADNGLLTEKHRKAGICIINANYSPETAKKVSAYSEGS